MRAIYTGELANYKTVFTPRFKNAEHFPLQVPMHPVLSITVSRET